MTAAPLFPSGSHLLGWTGVGVFWMVCLIVVLYQVWRGWRLGLARQLAAVAGLLAGWLIGLTQGPAFIAHFWSGSSLPSFILAPLASMVLGLVVYALAIVAGKLFFKRACDHSWGPTRIFLGSGGAIVGFFLGLFAVWILIVLVRLGGAIAQAPVGGADAEEHPAKEEHSTGLAAIRHSVESGFVGSIVRFTDPFPKEAYPDVTKVVTIATDPALQERLLDAPSLHDIASDPKFVAMRQDPSIMDAVQRRDYLSLLNNPRVLAVMNDQRLSKRLEKVDVTKLLNETVQ